MILRLCQTLLLAILIIPSFGQNRELNTGHIVNKRLLVHGGIVFKPINKYSNRLDTVKCDSYKEFFYLNGFQINKEQFMKLNLSHKDLNNDSTTIFSGRNNKSGYGTYQYQFKDGQACSNKITYRMEVKLPFFLNGKVVNRQSLTEIKPLTIERENRLFCADEIHIQTK